MVYVSVPRGTDEGEVLVLAEKGHQLHTANSVFRGDVKVAVRRAAVPEEACFRREGVDLHCAHTISVKDALCGFTFNLEHLNGNVYTMTSSAGTVMAPGTKKTVPELGFVRDLTPSPGQQGQGQGHGQCAGNLIVEFHVQFPTRLAKETAEALAAIDF